MADGLPTVTFRTPVNQEILGPLGRYAVLDDDQSLTDELVRLLADPEADRIGRGMRARAVEHFSWDAEGERILDIYMAALKARA